MLAAGCASVSAAVASVSQAAVGRLEALINAADVNTDTKGIDY